VIDSRSLGVFLALLVGAWLLQGALSFWQAKRFYGRIQRLRKLGRAAVGMSGNMYKTKVYGVLVVDERDQIVLAEKLTGWTVFARLRTVDLLAGRTLSDLLSGPIEGLSSKVSSAFQMAAETLTKEDEPDEDEAGPEASTEALQVVPLADGPSDKAVGV